MPKRKGTPKNLNSGRKKGSRNKATKEIRALVQRIVDWEKLTLALQKRAIRKSDMAARLLYEYGWGKPAEMGASTGLSGTELVAVAKAVAQAFMANTGEGVGSSGDSEGQE